MVKIKEAIQQIKQRIDCISYARDVLGFPISKEGDRCQGIEQSNVKNDSLMFSRDGWYDFHLKEGGDVISLAQKVKFNGDFMEAVKDLAMRCNIEIDDKHNYNWVQETKTYADEIETYHKNLKGEHLGYFMGRGFTEDFLRSIKLGTKGNNIIIPCLDWYNTKLLPCYHQEKVYPKGKYKSAPLDMMPNRYKSPYGLHTLKRNMPLIITEGIVDAMSADQEGYQSLSPLGLEFNKEIEPKIWGACRAAKEVVLCFDNDEPGQEGMFKLGMKLFYRNISFSVFVPPIEGEDLNDYYQRKKSLNELMEQKEAGYIYLGKKITDKNEFRRFIRKMSSTYSPDDVAEFMGIVKEANMFSPLWLKETALLSKKMPPESDIVDSINKKHKYFYNEALGFYEYSMGCYRPRQNTEIHSVIKYELGNFAKGTIFGSVRKHIEAMSISVDELNKGNYLNFVNGMLNLDTGEMEDHDSTFLSTIQLDYCYDPDASCQRFREFIDEITNGNEKKQKLLQEIAGYTLYSDNSLQKAFVMIGAGSNGKSVFLKTLTKVFNKNNTTNVEIASLVESFQRIKLMKSMVNICSEMSADVSAAATFFKQIVAGDPVSGCYKHKDHIEFTPRVKFICATNSMFRTKDVTDGFLRRISFIKFDLEYKLDKKDIRRPHHRKADIHLEKALEIELPGIFNWCYAGYKRLQKQERFTETDEQKYLIKDLKNTENPHMVFFEEVKEIEYTRESLWKTYFNWCVDQHLTSKLKSDFYLMADISMIKEYNNIGEAIYNKK